MENIEINDESGDRKYFTIVPNYILNHSTSWERDVYIQMKRIAGEKGTCWTSRATLAKQCGMSIDRLKKSIKYLVEHKWIEMVGKKTIKTIGGTQQVNEYRIIDLWHLNNSFYQGGSPNNLPLDKGGSSDSRAGGSPNNPKEEPNTNKNISKTKVLQVLEVREGNTEPSEKSTRPTKYPHSKEVFSWFVRPQKAWAINTTELKHAELLWERGEKQVRAAIRMASENRDDSYCPDITKPSQLEQKWSSLYRFAGKKGLL